MGATTPTSARTSAPPGLARDAEGRGSRTRSAPGRSPSAGSRNRQYTAFGYPAEPTLLHPTFDGERLSAVHSAVTGSDSPPGSGPATMQIDCDMSGDRAAAAG